MRYPYIAESDCRELADCMRSGLDPALEPRIHPQGRGEDLDIVVIEQAAARVDELLERSREEYSRDRDRLEGRAAPILYDAVRHADIEVLDDPGFWRYLSLKHFWSFIKWREHKAFDMGNHLKYVDGRNSTECVLTRMYIRVRALGGSEYGCLARALPKSTDFWRSHIIRVRTGTAPPLTRAFVRKQRDARLNRDELREFAKVRLNRLWTNVVPNVYDDEDARRLIDELWPT